METEVEDGIYMAMPYNVHVIFGVPVFGGIDDSYMHAPNSWGRMEYGF